ncbi:MAG: SpoIIE family protein phosphatase [Mycobacteriales bacterium]
MRRPLDRLRRAAITARRNLGDALNTEDNPTIGLHLDGFTRQLLDALPMSVLVESPTGEILYCNAASTAVYGWSPEEAVGRSALELGIAATDQRVTVEILAALVAGKAWSGEFTARTRTGQSLIVRVTAAPLVEGGETVAIVAASTDVTQRRLADEAFGLLDTLMTSAPVGLAFFDTDLRYVRVNAALAQMSGLPPEAHIGRRIADLLPGVEAGASALLARALAGDEPVCDVELTGVTPARPGVLRTWLSCCYPLRGPAGKPVGAGLVVVEITERKRHEAERERLLASERAARQEAERAQSRLALLAEAGSRLASSLDPVTTLANVAQLFVPRVADLCVVDLLEGDALRRAAVVVADEDRQRSLAASLRDRLPSLDGANPVAQVLRTGRPMVIPSGLADRVLDAADAADAAGADVTGGLTGSSAIVVPLVARGRVLGTLALASRAGAPPYDDEDLAVTLEIARRAAVALDNARLYAAEHRIADTLQRSLLPAEPLVAPGGQVAVRYLAADTESQVGGDFYDLIVVDDRPWTTAVGDVGGKGVRAAAVMGQLRAAVRAYALEGHEPAGVVRRLDRLFGVMNVSDFTTCIVASYDPATRTLTWANAGHLPALVRRSDGRCEWLRGPTALPLGLGDLGRSAQESERLHPGDLLVLYTDGLVERREESIDVGLDRLRRATVEAPCDP